MPRRRLLAETAALAGLATLIGLCAPARSGRASPVLDLTSPILGHESVAAVEGAGALPFNPAAIGFRYPSELVLSQADRESGPRLRGILLAGGNLGLAVREVEDGPRALTLGAAGGDRLRIGWSATWLRRGSDGVRATDHTLGTVARAAPWLSLGATASHLGEPRFQGAVLRRDYALGLGLRPLALSRPRAHTWGPRLTLTGDLELEEGARREQARVRFGAEVEAAPGVVLRGALEQGGSFRLGVALLGTRSGYHGHSAYREDGDRRETAHALSFHGAEDRTVLAGRRERRVAEIVAAGHLGDDALGGFSLLGSPTTVPAAALHRQLERALEDPLTRGVLLDVRGISNMAQIEELRPRIARLRAAGKPVVAFLEHGGGRSDLYLATACDRIVAPEEADFGALGLRAERRYYRGLLERWGVRFDRSSVGVYKSAYRGFSADSTPQADREAIEHGLDVQQELFVGAVAGDRRMERDRLLGLLDGRWWPADELRAAGLLDSVGYREDARRILGRLCGLGEKPRRVRLDRVAEATRAWRVPRPIAVVYASGAIETGESGHDLVNGPTLGSRTLTRQLERAFGNREVKAVVLRIESPGGSSLATSLIHHATRRLKREHKKPLVVSMGGSAASGGYYIALEGDRLFADRFTRTGSIGVVYLKPSLEGWYEKQGVRQDAFERGEHMGAWSLGRSWNERWQAAADSAIRVTYQRFKARVGEARGLSRDSVEQVARGRVWMGGDALARGLVDEIGGLEQAIGEARRRIGVPQGERIETIEHRRPGEGLLGRLLSAMVRDAWARVRVPEPGVEYRADVGDEE